ncbi:MAG TPA: hypothetical protein PLA83_09575, partial [Deltaproteobacteria bacterium]|nr:hypothetical protein [Deltaproteobacteria bacterium]
TGLSALNEDQRSLVEARVAKLLKENRYDPKSSQLRFLDAEKASYQRQLRLWADYFLHPTANAGLPSKYIHDPEEIRQLTAFFAWTTWASAANRPDKPYSYTNNFPYDPMVGNLLTADSLLWSALSVAMLLAGLALVLFTFGRFDYLGWKEASSLIRTGIARAISDKQVTYDLERQMEGATLLKCSEFAQAIVDRME